MNILLGVGALLLGIIIGAVGAYALLIPLAQKMADESAVQTLDHWQKGLMLTLFSCGFDMGKLLRTYHPVIDQLVGEGLIEVIDITHKSQEEINALKPPDSHLLTLPKSDGKLWLYRVRVGEAQPAVNK